MHLLNILPGPSSCNTPCGKRSFQLTNCACMVPCLCAYVVFLSFHVFSYPFLSQFDMHGVLKSIDGDMHVIRLQLMQQGVQQCLHR